QLRIALQICRDDGLLAMMPDVAVGAEHRDTLRRLPLDVAPARPLYALTRVDADEPAIALIVDAIADAVAQSLARSDRSSANDRPLSDCPPSAARARATIPAAPSSAARRGGQP